MNKDLQADKILQGALNALFETTGLQVDLVAGTNKKEGNFVLKILCADKTAKFSVLIKTTKQPPVPVALKAREHLLPHPPLLVAPYITRQTAKRCREIGLPFIDGAGNVYLEAPGLFVFVTGQPRNADLTMEKANYQALTPTGLRLVFMLLTKPTLLNAPYRDLAKAASIAIGGVGAVIKDLESRRYLTPEGLGPRRLLAADKLREEWVAHYPVKLRPKLQARRFTHLAINTLAPAWWKNGDLRPYDAVWGGEVGAEILTGYLRPETVTIYAHGPIDALITKFRLKPDPHGEIEILQTFWNQNDDDNKTTAPPLIVYADLMAAGNTRAIEAAKLIHERFLAWLAGTSRTCARNLSGRSIAPGA
jgi:hypothetical protein